MQLDDFIVLLKSAESKLVFIEDAIRLIVANFEVDEHERIFPRLKFEHHMQIVHNI